MWRNLFFHNEKFERGIQQLLRSGIVHVNHDTGIIEPVGHSMDFNSNWLFFGHTTGNRDCYLWHQVMFNHFDLVPDFCKLRCYKVVVKVRNFAEAMAFYQTMHAAPLIRQDLCLMHGKVGIDERYYSSGHFNGFIYCDGPEDAQEKYTAVRELVDTQIEDGKNIDIIIKRSCTEFEKSCGATDTDFWQSVTPEEAEIQSRLEDIFAKQTVAAVQPDWLRNKIIAKMTKWANTIGDKSWVDFFGGDDFLTMKAVTYHKKERKNGSGKG